MILPSPSGAATGRNLAFISGSDSSTLRMVKGMAVLFFTVKVWATRVPCFTVPKS
jgi:hypothetical protein